MLELNMPTDIELTMDSRALQNLATSIKEPIERLNKVDLAVMREAYDQGKLRAVIWSPGQKLLADALTKDNQATAELLKNALTTGRHHRPQESFTNTHAPEAGTHDS